MPRSFYTDSPRLCTCAGSPIRRSVRKLDRASEETLGHLPIVVVEQAAQHVAPADRAPPAGPVRGDWSALLKTLVRARAVVVAHVGREHAPQVGLVEDQQVVQALLPRRADPPWAIAFACGAR
jgi:hypothetical protein